jgi:hypothetical protein
MAVEAPWRVASLLRLSAGQPLLHLAETYDTARGRPVARSLNDSVTSSFNFHLVRRIPPRAKHASRAYYS